MAALGPEEMRELIIDAWRMVVPKKVAAARLSAGGKRTLGRPPHAGAHQADVDVLVAAGIDGLPAESLVERLRLPTRARYRGKAHRDRGPRPTPRTAASAVPRAPGHATGITYRPKTHGASADAGAYPRMSSATRHTTPTGEQSASAMSVPGISTASAWPPRAVVHDSSEPPGSVCAHSLQCHSEATCISSGYLSSGSITTSMRWYYRYCAGNGNTITRQLRGRRPARCRSTIAGKVQST